METRITATELSKSLPDVLSRVHEKGESFVVEHDGEALASIAPPATASEFTLRDLVLLMDKHGPLEGFADDLESIQRSQPKIGPPEWDR